MSVKRKLSFEKELARIEFRVAIFGSARIRKGDPTYTKVYTLAKMIGKKNIDIVTGGGPGLMEAANAGHRAGANGNSHSVGLLINLPVKQPTNNHLDIKKEFDRFSERLETFMTLSNVVVVAPGGLGTLLEFIYAWQLVQVKKRSDLRIILLGTFYKELLTWIRTHPLKERYLGAEDIALITLAKTPQEAMRHIASAYDEYVNCNH